MVSRQRGVRYYFNVLESRRSSVSSVDNSPPITIDGLLSSSYLAAFRAHIDNSATTSTSSNQLILPPSYDSLQPVPTDYDKSLPPNYYEVVELSLANSAATVAIQPPFIQPPVPVTAADSGLTSSEVAVSTLAPAENASPDAMTATRDRDNDASEQRQDDVPEDAVISCDVDDDNNGDGGKVNHAIDLTDEVEVTCRDNNRQTPDVDTPPTTVFQEVASVMEVDVDGRTLANSQS
jgi:hypothetical protein